MPSTLITLRKPRPPAERAALIDAVHAAMVEALKIPPQDRCLRLQTFAPEDFAVPTDAGESFTLIEISLYPGRSLAAKRALYAGLVERLAAFGIAAQELRVILHEVPSENWGLRGIAGCDVGRSKEILA